VDLLYSLGTSVTIPVKGATTTTPIVFACGGDTIAYGLVDNLARPGGRLTGVQYLSHDLTAKRLELLKELLPNLRKIVTYFDPTSPVIGIRGTRDAARLLNIEVIEDPVSSAAELRQHLGALRPKHADAYFYTPDAMVMSQIQLILDAARERKLPTMVSQASLVARGALVGYGVDFRDIGKLSATYIQRILVGKSPATLPVESFSRLKLGVNLKAAREFGITVPPSILFRADTVLE
jgi:putative ABC transport system substrate-binding protein